MCRETLNQNLFTVHNVHVGFSCGEDMPMIVISANDKVDFSRPVNWVDWLLGRNSQQALAA